MGRKVIRKKMNSSDDVYALVTDGQTYEVWKLCVNYDGNVKGGVRKTWRYIEKGMSKESAEKLFNRRTK